MDRASEDRAVEQDGGFGVLFGGVTKVEDVTIGAQAADDSVAGRSVEALTGQTHGDFAVAAFARANGHLGAQLPHFARPSGNYVEEVEQYGLEIGPGRAIIEPEGPPQMVVRRATNRIVDGQPGGIEASSAKEARRNEHLVRKRGAQTVENATFDCAVGQFSTDLLNVLGQGSTLYVLFCRRPNEKHDVLSQTVMKNDLALWDIRSRSETVRREPSFSVASSSETKHVFKQPM